MACKIKNQNGILTINNEVIAKIAGHAAMECYGIVGMAAKNLKDGFAQLLNRENIAKGIRITADGGGIVIDLHIIVEYGTNIPAISDTLVSTVKYRVEECIGINVDKINIFVEGIRVNL